MITSAIEMVELPKFGHMTTSTIQFVSRDFDVIMDRNYDITIFILRYLYFKKI